MLTYLTGGFWAFLPLCVRVCVNMGAGFREEMSRGLLYRHFTTNLLGRTLTFCLTHNITLHAVGVSLNEKRQKKFLYRKLYDHHYAVRNECTEKKS